MTRYFKERVVVSLLQEIGSVETPDTTEVRVLAKDNESNVTHATGTTVPSDNEAGYAKGCIFVDSDVAAGTSGTYENVGDTTNCNFDQLGSDLPPGSIENADVAADAGIEFSKMESLAQGSIITGQTGAGVPTALDAKTDAQLLLGDGTDLNSVPMSQDATIDNAGVTTVNGASGPFGLKATPIAYTSSGAVDPAITRVNIDSNLGVLALTLADGADGHMMRVTMTVAGNNAVITPTNLLGASSITFSAVGDTIDLMMDTGGWVVMGGTATVA